MKSNYNVNVERLFRRTYIVRAESLDEAQAAIERAWDEDIIPDLTYDEVEWNDVTADTDVEPDAQPDYIVAEDGTLLPPPPPEPKIV